MVGNYAFYIVFLWLTGRALSLLFSFLLLLLWICQWIQAWLLTMTGTGSYSPLTLSIISARSSNSNRACSAFPKPYRFLFTPTPSPLLHTLTHTHTFINTRQVIGITQKMGKSWREVLPQGTMSVHYGLVNDRICPQAVCEGVRLTVFPWGCSSNLVILSWQSWCMLHNTLPFHAADTKFTDKVANFHPYCPVTLNEKWTIRTAGMCWCFEEACSNSLIGYITFRCCLASQ